MRRKVLKVGNASLAVSLPSKWARHHGIEAGQEVDITERDGGLHVMARATQGEERLEVTLPPASEYAKRLLISPYIQGYSEILLHYEEQAVRKLIDNTMPYLMGFEIVDQRKQEVRLKNISQGLEEEFEPMYQRLIHLVRLMFEALRSEPEEIPHYAVMTDKLHHFLRRLLNTRVQKETKYLTSRYRIVCTLETIADDIKHISDDAEQHGLKELPVETCLKLHDAYTRLETKPTTNDLARFKHACLKAQRELKERIDASPSFQLCKLWEITEKYRALTEDLLFPF